MSRPTIAASVLAVLALPGVVAVLVPALLVLVTAGLPDTLHPAGVVALMAGLGALLWCVCDFHRAGRGTLAPWAPPARLVTTGLYARSRNPMYVGVVLMLTGWALMLRSVPHAVYAAVVAGAFHLRVVMGEEPYLARRHGEAWRRYAQQVPRWLLRVRPAPARSGPGAGRTPP